MLSDTIGRVLDGDRDAYEQIVSLHQDMLTAFAAFRIPDAHLVDEVVQQTFIRAYEQLADFEPEKDFGVWLRTICRFVIMAELKRAASERRNVEHYRDRITCSLVRVSATDAPAEADVLALLERCVSDLEEGSQRLLGYRYGESLGLPQIASRQGRSVAWVATTLFRIRASLRRCLERRLETEGT